LDSSLIYWWLFYYWLLNKYCKIRLRFFCLTNCSHWYKV
jgi:hypothetical protein